MVDIYLTCRFSREIDKDSGSFVVEINTDDNTITLEDKVYEKISDGAFPDLEVSQLELWKVELRNDFDLSKLVLKNNEKEGIKKLRGKICDYWKGQPSTETTHLIVTSPFLIKNKLIEERNNEIEELTAGISTLSTHDIKRGSFLSHLFGGIETPNGKIEIKNGDNIKLDDKEVGEVVITKNKRFIKCKVQNTEKYDECTSETKILKACNGGDRPYSNDVDSWRMRIFIKDQSLYDLKNIVENLNK